MASEWVDSARSIFGRRLRAARTERGYTQVEVAARIGVAQTTIANYEQGLRFPEEITLRRIADLFEVSIDWLFGRIPDPPKAPSPPFGGRDQETVSTVVEGYIGALVSGDRAGATQIVRRLEKEGWSTGKVYRDLFEPALKECGLRWMRNEMDIAQEHFITHHTEVLMAQLLSRTALPARTAYSLVGVSVFGDLHNIGVRMVCDFLELEGWTTYYLGNDLPTGSVVGAVVRIRPTVLAISATMQTSADSVLAVVEALRRNPEYRGTPVMVGGGAFNADPTLWRRVGADAWAASAAEAVESAKRIAGDRGEKTRIV